MTSTKSRSKGSIWTAHCEYNRFGSWQDNQIIYCSFHILKWITTREERRRMTSFHGTHMSNNTTGIEMSWYIVNCRIRITWKINGTIWMRFSIVFYQMNNHWKLRFLKKDLLLIAISRFPSHSELKGILLITNTNREFLIRFTYNSHSRSENQSRKGVIETINISRTVHIAFWNKQIDSIWFL